LCVSRRPGVLLPALCHYGEVTPYQGTLQPAQP
jgi:hypothetical protein